MCTLVLAWQVFPEAPVTVAANRDEVVDRPADPPARRAWDRPVVAPVDAEAGGTWLGYNDEDVFVGLTNRWAADSLAGDRSRGLLVRDALGYESAEAATRFVEATVDAHEYQGFNLVLADPTAALYLEWDGHLRVSNLEPGVHVVVNVGADGQYTVPAERPDRGEEQAANADAVRTALQPEPGEGSSAWLDRAADVIGDHSYGVCVHGHGFGTRSSSLIRLGDSPSHEFADGPPCETDFEPVVVDP